MVRTTLTLTLHGSRDYTHVTSLLEDLSWLGHLVNSFTFSFFPFTFFVFINKVLLEYNYTHLLSYCVSQLSYLNKKLKYLGKTIYRYKT